jgi:hypothetical protein
MRIPVAACLAVMVAGSAFGQASAADPNLPVAANVGPARTGKERLTDKASDEQRMDDCKVAPARRTRQRPTNCAGGPGG